MNTSQGWTWATPQIQTLCKATLGESFNIKLTYVQSDEKSKVNID